MKTPRLALILGFAVVAAAPALVADQTITGNLTVTGNMDSAGSMTSFGTQTTDPTIPGVIWTYTNNSVDTFQSLVNRNPASWLWVHSASVPAMRLDSGHNLLLFPTGANLTTTPASITLSPAANPSLSLGSATLSNQSGVLTASAFTVTGVFTGGSLNATGSAILGSTGTGTNAEQLVLDGGSGTGGGSTIYFRKNGITKGQLGNESATFISNSDNISLYMPAGSNFDIFPNGLQSPVATFSGNGLNVTGKIGIGTIGPALKLSVYGTTAYPAISGTSQTGIARFEAVNNNVMDFGQANVSPWGTWIQSTDRSNLSLNYPLLLNPNGGPVGIGTTTPRTSLDVIGGVSQTYGGANQYYQSAGNEYWRIYPAYSDGAYYISRGAQNPGGTGALDLYKFKGNGTLDILNGGLTTTGNVGIGTTSPTGKLDILGSSATNAYTAPADQADLRVLSSQNRSFDGGIIEIGGASGATGYIKTAAYNVAAGSMIFGTRRNSTDTTMQPTMILDYNGNVGIGTTAPNASLDIWKSYNAGTDSLRFSFNDGSAYWMGIQPYVAGPANVGYRFRTNNVNTTVDALAITGDGNVGIGTLNPTQKLAVNGTIRAKEIIVDTGWADYVFDPNYRLAPLSEVEQHIKAEKHLPGIPSAQEIAEHGVSMGDMQAKLLSKIEELTLHMIQQEKRAVAQDARIDRLEQENRQLRSVSANP